MRASSFVFAIALLGAVTGCERQDRLSNPDSTVAAPSAPEEGTAFLSVSDLSPKDGGSVTVAGSIALGDSTSLGSFRVRLAYDTTLLAYLEEVPLPGMMRVVNPTPGEIIVVGATSGTSSDGRLFALRFRVRDAGGLASLALHVDEMNDGSFTNQAPTVRRASRLVLDRALAPVTIER